MIGGGTFITQNKVLPGAYFSFVSRATATANLADRGVVALGVNTSWGEDNKIIEVSSSDFQKNSMKLFGYAYTDNELKDLREVFRHAKKVYAYKLSSGGVKASCTIATALYGGTRGNSLKVVVQKDIDDTTKFVVSLYLGTSKVDEQIVTSASLLVANDYVTWKSDATLAVSAGLAFTGGTDGTISTTSHQAFLDKVEAYPDINAIGYVGSDEAIKGLYASFVKRMRDDVGIKMQSVLFAHAGDSIGVVNVKNQESLVPWVLGVIAGTPVNRSATNMLYDGELTINTSYTQKQLESAIKAGEFTLHQIGTEVRVLEDINSLVSTTDELGDIFKDNQTVRVIDSIAQAIASIFVTKYLGKVPNNASGRTSLWSDVVKIHQDLNDIQAIEDFNAEDIVVSQGNEKKSVVIDTAMTVVNTMTKLYMKTIVA